MLWCKFTFLHFYKINKNDVLELQVDAVLAHKFANLVPREHLHVRGGGPGRTDPLIAPIGGNVNKNPPLFLSLLIRNGM
jgi:hypothetical protein